VRWPPQKRQRDPLPLSPATQTVAQARAPRACRCPALPGPSAGRLGTASRGIPRVWRLGAPLSRCGGVSGVRFARPGGGAHRASPRRAGGPTAVAPAARCSMPDCRLCRRGRAGLRRHAPTPAARHGLSSALWRPETRRPATLAACRPTFAGLRVVIWLPAGLPLAHPRHPLLRDARRLASPPLSAPHLRQLFGPDGRSRRLSAANPKTSIPARPAAAAADALCSLSSSAQARRGAGQP
jgi:hypothetical protein